MKISIIGTGYVGLVSGACLAETGHEVVCVDVEADKVERINRALAPFYEPGLPELLHRHVPVRLRASQDLAAAVRSSELSFIAVGTPFDGERIDLSYVRAAAEQIGLALREIDHYHVVVVKSTVVPGTTDEVVTPILESASGRKAGRDFGVGMNPEFLTEGVAVSDFMQPDRIVLGSLDARSIEAQARVYAGFPHSPRLETNNRTAELIKYTSNAVLATLISFSNEIGNLCAKIGGVDVAEVMKGVHSARYFSPLLDDGRRVSAPITAFLYAGCGFGGSCLPKDVKALIAHGNSVGESMPLLEAVININRQQPQRVIALLRKHFPSLRGVRVAVLGLAFKPDTDDMRESPAIPIVRELLALGARVLAYDPIANDAAKRVLPPGEVTFARALEEAIDGVDAIALLTSWEVFRRVPEILRGRPNPPLFVDGRRMLDKQTFARYEGIGL